MTIIYHNQCYFQFINQIAKRDDIARLKRECQKCFNFCEEAVFDQIYEE